MMFLLEASSETLSFRNLCNHIFGGPQFGKYIVYEGHLFFLKMFEI